MECGSGGSKNGNANNESCCATNFADDEEEKIQMLAKMKAKLTPMEYQVTQEKVTERPFSNRYNRHWEAGSYHCVVCNTEIFKSETKFESKSGWPAFYNVVDENRIKLKADTSHVGVNILLLISRPDLARNEVSCSFCKSHLGHLFQDGPKPTGLRYCVNSNSLIFHPLKETSDDQKVETASTSKIATSSNNNNSTSCSSNGNGNRETLTSNVRATASNDEVNENSNKSAHVEENVPAPSPPSVVKVCINNNSKPKKNSVGSVRRDSASSASGRRNSSPSKGKFCIFTQCLPTPTTSSRSSPETSPTTPRNSYAPSTKKDMTATATATVTPATAKSTKKSNNNSKVQKSSTSNCNNTATSAAIKPSSEKEKVINDDGQVIFTHRFGSNVPSSPSAEAFIQSITRRPSNGILRETAL